MELVATSFDEILALFLPGKFKKVTRAGIEFPRRKYWHQDLAQFVGKRVSLWVMWDPRDISHIFVQLPDKTILKVPSEPALPRMSLWEWKRQSRALKDATQTDELLRTRAKGIRGRDSVVRKGKAATYKARKAAAVEAEHLRGAGNVGRGVTPHVPPSSPIDDFDPRAPVPDLDVEVVSL